MSERRLKMLLRRVFGAKEFRPGQADVIRAVLRGRDTLAIMPTGSGKSLCYQLPALELDGTTVVVSPLLSLMKDQTDKLRAVGLEASQVNSAASRADVDQSFQHVREKSGFVFTTPERLSGDAAFFETLRRGAVARFVVDEAHCVSQWGHDFRPAYTQLKEIIERLGHPPVLALTATATSDITGDIIASLGLRTPQIVNTGIYRPNLRLEVRQTPNDEAKRVRVVERLRAREGAGIVYAATIRQVESLYADLTAGGFAAGRYHGRLPLGERRETQDAFMGGALDVIVATNAFGMGIDRPDIRFVMHYAMPGSLEAYYQEAGRAGRDGQDARCVLLFNAADQRTHRYFIGARVRGARTRLERKGLEPAQVGAVMREHERRRRLDEQKLERMIAYGQSASCRWKSLLEYFEEPVAPEFRCGVCDVCVHPPEQYLTPPGAPAGEAFRP